MSNCDKGALFLRHCDTARWEKPIIVPYTIIPMFVTIDETPGRRRWPSANSLPQFFYDGQFKETPFKDDLCYGRHVNPYFPKNHEPNFCVKCPGKILANKSIKYNRTHNDRTCLAYKYYSVWACPICLVQNFAAFHDEYFCKRKAALTEHQLGIIDQYKHCISYHDVFAQHHRILWSTNVIDLLLCDSLKLMSCQESVSIQEAMLLP